eukprot:4126797-Ditylum_brightwellii.AAC.1
MDAIIQCGTFFAIYHERANRWYPAVVITHGWDSHGHFYCIIWIKHPRDECCAEAVVDSVDIALYYVDALQ